MPVATAAAGDCIPVAMAAAAAAAAYLGEAEGDGSRHNAGVGLQAEDVLVGHVADRDVPAGRSEASLHFKPLFKLVYNDHNDATQLTTDMCDISVTTCLK